MNVTIEVYDTICKRIVEVEVDEAFAKEYKRMIWKEENSDRSFRKHQTVTSQLKGGEDDSFENFHEFIVDDEYGGSDNTAIRKSYLKRMKECLSALSEVEKKVIELIFFKSLTESQAANEMGIYQQNVHRIKARALSKLHKLLEK